MRFRPALCTYTHCSQRKKKKQKERNDYYYSFNLLNPKGTIHLLLKGDILTSYEQDYLQIIYKLLGCLYAYKAVGRLASILSS